MQSEAQGSLRSLVRDVLVLAAIELTAPLWLIVALREVGRGAAKPCSRLLRSC